MNKNRRSEEELAALNEQARLVKAQTDELKRELEDNRPFIVQAWADLMARKKRNGFSEDWEITMLRTP